MESTQAIELPAGALTGTDTQAATANAHGALTRIRLWDLPLRIFHWSLVLAVSVAVVTGEIGGSWMAVHAKAGLAIVGLVIFRIVWGFVGSTHARFASFAPTPARIRSYLAGKWHGIGHNPLGALSVFALLALLAVQAATGLVGTDEIDFSGPLASLVAEDLSVRLTGLHHKLAYALFALAGLHVAAITFYLHVKKQNLVKPMVTGWKSVKAGESTRKGGPIALGVALILALAGIYLASGGAIGNTASASAPAQTKSSW